jgi:hypothetical protein
VFLSVHSPNTQNDKKDKKHRLTEALKPLEAVIAVEGSHHVVVGGKHGDAGGIYDYDGWVREWT